MREIIYERKMHNQDSNLRPITSTTEDIFLRRSAGFRCKPQLAFDGFQSIVNHYPRHYQLYYGR